MPEPAAPTGATGKNVVGGVDRDRLTTAVLDALARDGADAKAGDTLVVVVRVPDAATDASTTDRPAGATTTPDRSTPIPSSPRSGEQAGDTSERAGRPAPGAAAISPEREKPEPRADEPAIRPSSHTSARPRLPQREEPAHSRSRGDDDVAMSAALRASPTEAARRTGVVPEGRQAASEPGATRRAEVGARGGGSRRAETTRDARTTERAERRTSRATPRDRQSPSRAKTDARNAPGAAATDAITAKAAGLSGIAYRWGGTTTAGFDCSGFTRHVYAKVGVELPRTAAQQQRFAKKTNAPRPGDLVFFGAPAHHVGIYAGKGKMYDSPRTGKTTGLHRIWSPNVTYGRVARR